MWANDRKPQKRVVVGERNVLRELHAGGPQTAQEVRASLERRRVDDPPSVGATRVCLTRLEKKGLVRRGSAPEVGIRAPATKRPGRPPGFATLSDAWGLGLGIEIGGANIRIAIVDPSGALQSATEHELTNQDFPKIVRSTGALVSKALEDTPSEVVERIGGVVIALNAAVDRRNRRVSGDALPGWDGQPLDTAFAKDLAKCEGLERLLVDQNDADREPPITVIGDANARGIGEARFGLARGRQSALVIKVSGTISAAVLRHGRLLDGYRGVAGQIGHMPVVIHQLDDPAAAVDLPLLSGGARCSCGDVENEHLEAYASTDAIAGRIPPRDGVNASDFYDLATDWTHNAATRLAIEDAGRLLGQALATAVLLIDPEVVVVTGRFAQCGEKAVRPIEDAIREARPRAAYPPEVLVVGPPGSYDVEAKWMGVRGAGRLAIELNTSIESRLE